MNREILFRGKRVDNGAWIYGYYAGPVALLDTYEICDISDPVGTRSDVDPTTICQYTGMTDKNGVKIFEGDIVHIHDLIFKYGDPNHEFNGYVDFANGSFVILGINEVVHYRWLDYDITVIGNIHDDPEILGGM